MMSAHRYVAYTSDIGESFRPVAHPWLVRGAYGVSWIYVLGDTAHEGYKAYIRNQRILHPELDIASETPGGLKDKVRSVKEALTSAGGVKAGGEGSVVTGGEVLPGRIPAIEDYRAVMAQRATFQAVASMGLPALTIHSVVRYSGRAMKNVKNKTVRTWGPIGVSFLVQLAQFMLLMESSWVWRSYRSCRTFSTNRLSMRRNGSFTMRSKRLGARRRWRDVLLQGRKS